MLYFGLTIFGIYIIFKLLYLLIPHMRRFRFSSQAAKKHLRFSVLVPAFNEQSVILGCIKSLANMRYANYDVFVVNDGSSDDTFDRLNAYLQLMPIKRKKNGRLTHARIISVCRSKRFPNIYVINKRNGGKADALNAGIVCCRSEYVVTLDADCTLARSALKSMNRAFQDRRVIAAGGTVHVIQGVNKGKKEKLTCRTNGIVRFQTLQYLTAFYMHKMTQSAFGALIVISGAYGAFKRSVLLEVGGYRKSVGEDMDITLKIHRYIKASDTDCMMRYVPESVCYTECPENFVNLTKQRIRWQKAFLDCARVYGFHLFRKFGFGISMFFLLDALLLGTITAMMVLLVPVYFAFSDANVMVFTLLFGADFLLGVFEGISAICLSARHGYRLEKRSILRMSLFIPFQLLTYRFLNILYVFLGLFSYIRNKNHWNKAARMGRTLPSMRWEQKSMFRARVSHSSAGD